MRHSRSRIWAFVSALALIAGPGLARAEPGCGGCNIVDARVFGDAIVGRELYYQQSFGGPYLPVRVTSINVSRRLVYWRDAHGRAGSSAAHLFFTEASRSEQETNAGAAVLGAVVLQAIAEASASESARPSTAPRVGRSAAGEAR